MKREYLESFLSVPLRMALLLALVAKSTTLEAREIIYGKAKETLAVTFGMETLLRFPMEVKTITEAQRFEIRPANQEEPDYSVLAIKPRMREGSADVAFMLADGSLIRTQLVITATTSKPNSKRDSVYDFKAQEELSTTNPNLLDKREPLSISELDLMRSMIGGQLVSGFEVKALNQKIEFPRTTDPESLSVRLIQIYRGSSIQGFVYLIETDAKTPKFRINLDQLAVGQPNLALLAQIDRSILGGETLNDRRTVLRVVTKPGASSKKLFLPTALPSEVKS